MFTWVEIEKEAIKYNLKQFRNLIGSKRLLMPVIKSNAYGHGLMEIAKICLESKEVDRICVVNLDEALELLKLKHSKPIFILSFYELEEDKLKHAVKYGVIFPLYSFKQAVCLNEMGKKLGKMVKVHLKIDTGTSRIGILPQEAISFVKSIQKLSFLHVEGLWSHLASSEEDKKFTLFQLETFKKVDTELREHGIVVPLKHIACTASTILYPESYFDAVRVGLGIYGLHPSKKTMKIINLKPALTLNTKIIQLKDIPKLTRVSYGGEWTALKKTKLAVIPLGYFDGYDRKLSNKIDVLIKDVRCPLRGRVCMNLSMIDVSKLKRVSVGDRVTIFGKSISKSISAQELAQRISTINYEIVARINPLIPRVYI